MDPTQLQQVGAPSGGSTMPQGAPMDSTQVPAQPGQDGGQPVSDQQKQALLDMISQIRAKLGSLSAVRFASSNKTELLRRDLLQQVFEKLQLAGVDLSSTQSVAAFIAKLQEQNPELAVAFEKAMDALLGGQAGGEFATPQDPNATIDLGIPPQNQNMNNNINSNAAIPPG